MPRLPNPFVPCLSGDLAVYPKIQSLILGIVPDGFSHPGLLTISRIYRYNWVMKMRMRMKINKFKVFFVFCLMFLPLSVVAENVKTHEILVFKDTFRFSPEVLHISIGEKVRWVNEDTRIHQFASVPGSGPTGDLEFLCEVIEPEGICNHTFLSSGEYPYFCFIHKQMLGLVIVGE